MSDLIVTQLGSLSAVGQTYAVQAKSAGSHVLAITLVGIGAISFAGSLMGSNDNKTWIAVAAVAASGTGSASGTARVTDDYAYWAMSASSLTGTSATVSGVLTTDPGASVAAEDKSPLRAAQKSLNSQPALIRATVWSASEVIIASTEKPVVRRLPDNPNGGVNAPNAGQLVMYTASGTTATAPAAGADPFTYSSIGEMTDGTAKCWALGILSKPVPVGVGIPTVTATAGNTAQTQVLNFKTDAAKFLQFETPNIADATNASNSVGWLYNNGSTAALASIAGLEGKMAYKRVLRFRTDAAVLDFVHIPNASGYDGASRPQFVVDGRVLEEVPSPNLGDGTTQRYVVSYAAAGGTKWRSWKITVPAGCAIRGIGVGARDTVEPDVICGLKARVVMDSFAVTTAPQIGFGATDTLGERVCRDLGLEYVLDTHEGGTGYLLNGSNSRKNALYVAQNNDFSALGVDVVLMGGLMSNDVGAGTYAAAEIAAAFAATFKELRRQHPAALICVFSGWYSSAAAQSNMNAADAAMQSAFIALNDPNSAWESPITGTRVTPLFRSQASLVSAGLPWFSGYGYVGAPTGSGNSDIYRGIDNGGHPSPAGKAAWLVPRLVESAERMLLAHGL